MILLPETRARFRSISVHANALRIELAGATISTSGVQLVAAVGVGEETMNMRYDVNQPSIDIPLPPAHDWWDIVLLAQNNDFLDKWSSREFMRLAKIDAEEHSPAESLVRQALETGEGQRVEFKPFVEPPSKKKGVKSEKAELKKFSEVLQTVAAMANAGGGHIFMGVTDECAPSDDTSVITKWGDCELSDDLIESYRNAILARLNDRIIIQATLKITTAKVDGAPVIIIEIPPTRDNIVSVEGDHTFYLRRGATNKRISPSDWSLYAPKDHDFDAFTNLM